MDAQTDRNKIAILVKLSLHYWKPDLTTGQQKQRWDDYLADLAQLSMYDLEQACAAWRQSDENHFPTPGQLLAKVKERRERSIVNARANAPAHRALFEAERRFPKDLRPWREILADNDREIPTADSAIARGLDALQP